MWYMSLEMSQWLSTFHANMRIRVWVSGTYVSVCCLWWSFVGTRDPQSQLASETCMSVNFGFYWKIHTHPVRWKSDWGCFSTLISEATTCLHTHAHTHICKHEYTHKCTQYTWRNGKRKKKMWPIYTREFYAAIKKNIMACAVKMKKVEILMLSKISTFSKTNTTSSLS